MLAGYLPFDDDPANPEGDNINLLYKYIVSTPLTFPEYVTPHARDLLKRILVPDPRKRADLFEVARHSWLADYAHVVGFITTSNADDTQQQGSVYASTLPFESNCEEECTDPLAEDPYEHPRLLPEVHPSASQQRHKHLLQHMAASQPNVIRSIPRPRSQRRLATTSAAPFRSNMLLPNRKPSVAKPRPLSLLLRQHQRLVLSTVCQLNPQTQSQMATSRPPVRDRLALLVQQLDPNRSTRVVILRDQSLTTLLSVLHPKRQHGHRQVEHWVAPGCLREATLTLNRLRLPWPPPTRRVASRNPRARITPSLHHTLHKSLRAWVSRALASRAHNECSHLKLDLLAATPRAVTNGQTLSLRRWVA